MIRGSNEFRSHVFAEFRSKLLLTAMQRIVFRAQTRPVAVQLVSELPGHEQPQPRGQFRQSEQHRRPAHYHDATSGDVLLQILHEASFGTGS